MDRMTSSCAVYIDDRVKSERWIRRPSEGNSNTFEVLDESEDLKINVEMFLCVFEKGMFCVFCVF